MDDLLIPDHPEPSAPEPPLLAQIPKDAGAWEELGEVLWLSLPIIISMLSYTLMSFADALMLSRHSKPELAAVTAAAPFFFTFCTLMMGTLSITNTFVSQSVGRGRKQDGPVYVWQALYLAAMWSAVVFCFIPLVPSVFRIVGHAAHLQVHQVTYAQLIMLRMPAVGVFCAVSAFYQATKRPIVPMYTALISNAFNVLANYALIFGKFGFPEMGIKGAAIATVIATFLDAGLLLMMFLGPGAHKEYGTRSAWRVKASQMWQLLRSGVPSGFTWFLENMAWLFFVWVIIGRKFGEDAMAANGAAIQVLHLSFMPVVGLNIGIQAIVARHIGMKDYAGAKRRTYRAIGLALCYMVVMGGMFFLFRRVLIQLFVDPDLPAAGARRFIEMGCVMLIYGAIFQAFDATVIVCYGALKGAGDTFFCMWTTVICSWCIFMPCSWALSRLTNMGVGGAWFGLTVYIAALAAVYLWRLSSDAWRKIDIFEGEGAEQAVE
jgi:MATE family, multidrug efflux pump